MDYAAEYGAMHESDKRFPGYSLTPYVEAIGELIKGHALELDSRILDFGSGKGFQYLARRLHERWDPPILPHCYDIGVRQLAERPEGEFDGVICTDVLEHIEEQDVNDTLNTLVNLVRRGLLGDGGFLFLGISCRPSRKRLSDGRDVHVTIRPPSWWVAQVQRVLDEFDRDRDLHVLIHWDVAGHFDEPETPWSNRP